MLPAMILKRIYHCVPTIINTMLYQSSVTPTLLNARMRKGKYMGAGYDARICTIGCSMRDRRGDKPIANPAGTVHSVLRIRARNTRPKVQPPASAKTDHSP